MSRPKQPRAGSWIGGANSLAVLLTLGFAYRVVYVLFQARYDPWFARPILDGAYYLDWARSLLGAPGGPEGAYYLAPFYPHLLALFLALFGERLGWLYLLQQLVAVLAAAGIARMPLGDAHRPACFFAAALFLFHHPLIFFASRPLGEVIGIALLLGALGLAERDQDRSTFLGGIVLGLACLIRPNLMLVVVVWLVGELLARRPRRALLGLIGALLVILPITARNHAVSGHLVPISSNGGITLYHGNGPGAQGVYTHPAGFRLDLVHQRDDATRLAREATGRRLDPVEADGWWGDEAIRVRRADPLGSAALLAKRVLLTFDNHEHALDYSPLLDANPLRATVRLGAGREIAWVPFALLVGLAAAGLAGAGVRGSGGWRTWSAILACAAMPILFYVSSRYRLPVAALLALPAGHGLQLLVGPALDGGRKGRRRIAAVAALTVAMISLLVPSSEISRRTHGEGLANRAVAYLETGRPELALADAEEAIRLAPESARVRFNHGVTLEAVDQPARAEQAYRRAWTLDRSMIEAAGNLSGLLLRRGEWAEAGRVLEQALALRSDCEPCWNNLALARYAGGDLEGVRRTIERARAAGFALDPAMIQVLLGGGGEEKNETDGTRAP